MTANTDADTESYEDVIPMESMQEHISGVRNAEEITEYNEENLHEDLTDMTYTVVL